MIHGKKLVQLAQANAGIDKQQLIAVATKEFGADAQFRTCKVEGLNLDEMLTFFIENGRIEIEAGIKVNACDHCSKPQG